MAIMAACTINSDNANVIHPWRAQEAYQVLPACSAFYLSTEIWVAGHAYKMLCHVLAALNATTGDLRIIVTGSYSLTLDKLPSKRCMPLLGVGAETCRNQYRDTTWTPPCASNTNQLSQ